MKVQVITILTGDFIVIKLISDSGEYPEDMPIEKEMYNVYFEKIEPDTEEEFNI
jgi:hypothetical protein